MSMRVFLIGWVPLLLCCFEPCTARGESKAANLPVEAPKPPPSSVSRPVEGVRLFRASVEKTS